MAATGSGEGRFSTESYCPSFVSKRCCEKALNLVSLVKSLFLNIRYTQSWISAQLSYPETPYLLQLTCNLAIDS